MTLALRWRLAIALLAATMVGLAFLMYAERIGRLSMDVQYDDVSYAIDAVDRYEALEHGGWRALARSLAVAPTHSPFSVLLALAAFRVAGVHELSLYLANLVILWAAALVVVLVTRDDDDGTFAVGLLLVLPSALAYHSQTEFRPDPAYGLALAAMAVTLVHAAIDGKPRRAWLAGILMGMALMVKPTFFAHTLSIAGALGAACLFARWRRLPAAAARLSLQPRDVAGFFGVGILVSAPYFATAAAPIFQYFWSNTFGTYGAVHKVQDPTSPWRLLQEMAPLIFQLPRYHLHLTAAASVLLFAELVRRGAAGEALRIAALVSVAALSFAIVLAGGQRNFFFFAATDWTLVLACLAGYAGLARLLSPRWRTGMHLLAACVVVLVTAASLQGLRASWPWGARHGESENVRMLGIIRQDLARMGVADPPLVHVLVDSSGVVNPWVLRFVGRLNGMRVYGEETHFVADLRQLQALAHRSDYVIAINPDRAYFDQWLPLAKVQRPYYEWVMHDPGFEILSGNSASTYVLLANRDATPRFTDPPVVSANGAVESIEGLAGDDRSRSREIAGRHAKACFALVAGIPHRVSLRYEATGSGRITLRMPGEPPASAALSAKGALAGEFTPTAWSQNCLDIDVGAASPHARVDITGLRIEPREPK